MASATANVSEPRHKEEEFYAGLELKEVSAKGSEIFYAIDMNHDGTLSKGEMKIAAEIKTRTNKAIKQVQDSFASCAQKGKKSTKWGAGIGGVLGAAAIGGSMLWGLEEGALIGTIGGGVVGTVIGGIVGAAVGIGIAYFGGKSIDNDANYEKIFKEAMGNLATHSYAKYTKDAFMKAAKAIAAKYFED